MNTKRLFYEDVYIKEFDAVVLECRETKGGYHLILDKTAFYPEGGGQPCDLGWINDVPVKAVSEKMGEILHLISTPIESGQNVHGKIDWDRRFDLMQQHSGEHMVSGLIHERFGYDNVGFHMGNEIITIDLSGIITLDEMKEVEQEVNQKIWDNLPVQITYPSKEDLALLPYRSKKELTGAIRIVTFPGVDICACCGTHVSHTGEIGVVKLLSLTRFHDGVRMEMLCGKRVLEYMNRIDEQNHLISVRLSAKPEKTGEAVDRLWEENNRRKQVMAEMEEHLFEMEAEQYKGNGNVILFQKGWDADQVRRLTDKIMHVCNGRCAVFSDNGDGSYKYAIGEIDGNLQALTKEMNQALSGRGGGKPFFVQGSVKTTEKEIREFLERRLS